MGTEITNYEEQLKAMAQVAVQGEKVSGSSISVRSGILNYNGQPVPGNKLDAIIIASTHANLYYEDKFDPNSLSNPTCYAYGDDEKTMVPHPSVENPQSDSCAACPMNQWGSDPNGGRGKACQNRRILGLIPADTKPEEVPNAEVAVLKLPVTSVKQWGMYVNKLATVYQRPPLGMVTQIGAVPDSKTQFKLTFEDAAQVGGELLGSLFPRVEEVLTMLRKEYEPNPEESEQQTARRSGRAKKLS